MDTARASADAELEPLDAWLCLALYNASRAMTARYRPLLAELGLTYPQYLVLSVLWADGPCTVGQVGARLRLDSGTVSPLLHRLELAGLVARTRAAYDERLTVVRLTDRSEAMRDRAAAVPSVVCDATGLGGVERAALVEQLQTLVQRLDG